MFLRVKTTPNSPRRSIQICETYRKNGAVKQRIVHYAGIAQDEEEEQKLKDYGAALIAKITAERERNNPQQSLFDLTKEQVLEHVKNKPGRPARKKIEDILPPSEVSLDDVKSVL